MLCRNSVPLTCSSVNLHLSKNIEHSSYVPQRPVAVAAAAAALEHNLPNN